MQIEISKCLLTFGAESFVFYSDTQIKKKKKYIKRNIIFLVVLYGCATWSPTFREERRLRVFENRVRRRIFGPKRDEVIREWRKHNYGLSDQYSSLKVFRVTKSRRVRWAEHVARTGERRGAYRFWWGNLREDPGLHWRRKILR